MIIFNWRYIRQNGITAIECEQQFTKNKELIKQIRTKQVIVGGWVFQCSKIH